MFPVLPRPNRRRGPDGLEPALQGEIGGQRVGEGDVAIDEEVVGCEAERGHGGLLHLAVEAEQEALLLVRVGGLMLQGEAARRHGGPHAAASRWECRAKAAGLLAFREVRVSSRATAKTVGLVSDSAHRRPKDRDDCERAHPDFALLSGTLSDTIFRTWRAQ